MHFNVHIHIHIHIDVQRHEFFSSRHVDWRAVREKRIQPPFRPRIQCDEDVSQFDTRFTREPPLDSPVEDAQLAQISQSANNFFQVLLLFCLLCRLHPVPFILFTRTRTRHRLHLHLHLHIEQFNLRWPIGLQLRGAVGNLGALEAVDRAAAGLVEITNHLLVCLCLCLLRLLCHR